MTWCYKTSSPHFRPCSPCLRWLLPSERPVCGFGFHEHRRWRYTRSKARKNPKHNQPEDRSGPVASPRRPKNRSHLQNSKFTKVNIFRFCQIFLSILMLNESHNFKRLLLVDQKYLNESFNSPINPIGLFECTAQNFGAVSRAHVSFVVFFLGRLVAPAQVASGPNRDCRIQGPSRTACPCPLAMGLW